MADETARAAEPDVRAKPRRRPRPDRRPPGRRPGGRRRLRAHLPGHRGGPRLPREPAQRHEGRAARPPAPVRDHRGPVGPVPGAAPGDRRQGWRLAAGHGHPRRLAAGRTAADPRPCRHPLRGSRHRAASVHPHGALAPAAQPGVDQDRPRRAHTGDPAGVLGEPGPVRHRGPGLRGQVGRHPRARRKSRAFCIRAIASTPISTSPTRMLSISASAPRRRRAVRSRAPSGSRRTGTSPSSSWQTLNVASAPSTSSRPPARFGRRTPPGAGPQPAATPRAESRSPPRPCWRPTRR